VIADAISLAEIGAAIFTLTGRPGPIAKPLRDTWMNKPRLKTLAIWIVLVGVFVFLLNSRRSSSPISRVSIVTFHRAIDAGDVASYSFQSNGISFERSSTGDQFFVPVDWNSGAWNEDLADKLEASGAVYEQIPLPQPSDGLREVVTYLVAGVVVCVALYFILRRVGGGANQNIFALRNSKAKVAEESSKVRFDDVGGCVEAKQELSEIVNFLKSPQRWTDAGARLPRGVLLEGPPGCGKTLLARAVAGETNAKFYYTSASEFVEMFIGVGPARVRDMFDTAKKESPAVLFIDELDAIGRRRGSGVGFANEEREQTLNQILVCMDGFEPTDSVVVIAATNRVDILDKALVRAGRFDRRIRISPLDADQRAAVLKIHTRNKPLAENVSLEDVASWTDGLNGADLETLTNLAALLCVRRTVDGNGIAKIIPEDFRLALQKRKDQQQSYDALDAVLFEATTQLAEPTARAVVRIILVNGTEVEGDVLWIDPGFVKIRRLSDGTTCILPKAQIAQMEAREGTATVSAADIQPDRSSGSGPNFA
jgi:ATP-dependent Zn protease